MTKTGLIFIIVFIILTGIFSCSKTNIAKNQNNSSDTTGKNKGGTTPPDTGKKDTTTKPVKTTANPAITWLDNFYFGNDVTTSTTGHDIVTDAQGNIYVLGNFRQTFYPVAGSQSVAFYSVNNNAMYLAKYDHTGKYVWMQEFDCNNQFYSNNSLAIDASGNLYLAGSYSGAINFNDSKTILAGDNTQSGFIIKCNSDGQPVWETSISDGQTVDVYDIAVDASQNVYAIGRYVGNLYFSNSSLPMPVADNQCFIARFDENGKGLWGASVMGIVSVMNYGSIAVDHNNQPVFGLSANSDIYFLNTLGSLYLHNEAVDTSCFIGKLSADGKYQWVHEFANEQLTRVSGITTGTDNSIYYVGFSVVNNQRTDVLGKLNTNGGTGWTTNFSNGSGNGIRSSIALDAGGNIYTLGFFAQPITIGSQAFVSSSYSSLYLCRFNNSGTFSIGRAISGDTVNDYLSPGGIAMDASGNVDIFSFYIGTINNLYGGSAPSTNQLYRTFISQLLAK